MLIGKRWYFESIRKFIVCFADIFNSVKILKSDNTEYTVPIYFASKSTLHMRYRGAPGKKKITLPVMGYSITGLTPDKERMKNKLNKLYKATDTTFSMSYQSVPYTTTITLHLLTKYLDDYLQIVEQIGSVFAPHLNTSIVFNNTLGVGIDVPIELTDIAFNFESELSEDKNRVLEADFTFISKLELYKYISLNQEQIEEVILSMKDLDNDLELREITIDE